MILPTVQSQAVGSEKKDDVTQSSGNPLQLFREAQSEAAVAPSVLHNHTCL